MAPRTRIVPEAELDARSLRAVDYIPPPFTRAVGYALSGTDLDCWYMIRFTPELLRWILTARKQLKRLQTAAGRLRTVPPTALVFADGTPTFFQECPVPEAAYLHENGLPPHNLDEWQPLSEDTPVFPVRDKHLIVQSSGFFWEASDGAALRLRTWRIPWKALRGWK